MLSSMIAGSIQLFWSWSSYAPPRSTATAHCIDMHVKELRAMGEGDRAASSPRRLAEDSPFYSDRERPRLV